MGAGQHGQDLPYRDLTTRLRCAAPGLARAWRGARVRVWEKPGSRIAWGARLLAGGWWVVG